MKYADYAKQLIAEADRFIACEFTGKATYNKREARTQGEAEAHARAFIAARDPADTINKGRPVLVYAIRGSNQEVAATVYP